jgi:hypothetical protein
LGITQISQNPATATKFQKSSIGVFLESVMSFSSIFESPGKCLKTLQSQSEFLLKKYVFRITLQQPHKKISQKKPHTAKKAISKINTIIFDSKFY